MGLRDIAILLVVYGSVPFTLKKPFIGVLVWLWLSLMNPHRISWVLMTAPLAQVAALAMLLSILISRVETKKIPWTTLSVLLAVWWVWILLTTVFALNPKGAWEQWSVIWKTMLTTFIIIMMLNSRERLISAAVVMMFSIGFYGFKGGFFTIVTGGNHKVWGPPGSFLAGNNEVGLALIMTLPLVLYVRTLVNNRWLSGALLTGAFLCFAAILGTQSRGALVGVAAMGLMLALRSPNRFQYLALLSLAIPFAFLFMPESWFDRMATIGDYQSDASAMGRINAWWMAFYMALDNPITGGGLQSFTRYTFMLYAPVPDDPHDAHSIYFEILGEQGFVGLALFLGIGILTLAKCSFIRKQTKGIPELRWMFDLATMTQLSVLGFATSGLFLGLAYFDFYYMLIALVVGMTTVLARQRAECPGLFQPPARPATPRAANPAPGTVRGTRPRPTPARAPGLFDIKGLVLWGLDWYRRL